MSHRLYRIRLQPQTAFATRLRGDTLFGQCCWTLRHLLGEAALSELLHGYTQSQPFLVLSDAFPAGYLPRPEIPLSMLGYDLSNPEQRKSTKAKRWIKQEASAQPLAQWHQYSRSDLEISMQVGGTQAEQQQPLIRHQVRSHNSLNRLTGTTGTGEGFAPYQSELIWYHPKLRLELYACVDERLIQDQLMNVLKYIGLQGYGKNASAGLGKFDLVGLDEHLWSVPEPVDAWLTLAPCAPQGASWQAEHCFYRPHVRFGRHGGHHTGSPYKNPLLLADRAAILTPSQPPAGQLFCGQGLGNLSLSLTATVHQGYAPVLPVCFASGESA